MAVLLGATNGGPAANTVALLSRIKKKGINTFANRQSTSWQRITEQSGHIKCRNESAQIIPLWQISSFFGFRKTNNIFRMFEFIFPRV